MIQELEALCNKLDMLSDDDHLIQSSVGLDKNGNGSV
jgi:hypothetical protein